MRQVWTRDLAECPRAWRVKRLDGQQRAEPGQRPIGAYAHAIHEHSAAKGLGDKEDVCALLLEADNGPSMEPAHGWAPLTLGLCIEFEFGRHWKLLSHRM